METGRGREKTCGAEAIRTRTAKKGKEKEMGKGIAVLETAYKGLFTAILIALAVLVILCLIRAIIGPRIADRIVSVNMMGTMVIVIIAILTVMMGEGYLADICIIYAMISFLAVVVLTKVYIGIYEEKRHASDHPDEEDKGGMSDGSF